MYQIPSNIQDVIFRAYDIRGVVKDVLTPDVVYAVGRAFGAKASAAGFNTVAAGKDGRLSAPVLFPALCKGIQDSGCNVISIGAVPTSVLYYATQHLKTYAGIMLTGSHNPKDYNGLKMVINNKSLTSDEIQDLKENIKSGNLSSGEGHFDEKDVREAYIKDITSKLNLKRKMKVVVDCGNGIGGDIFPRLIEELGCDVVKLHCEIDGNFPNHHPDPSVAENLVDLQNAVIENKADIGLALDGDCDRLGVVSSDAKIIWPDRLMMFLSREVLKDYPGEKIIFDVKCSRHLATIIKEAGGEPVMSKTGHSLLKKKLQETKAPLAGELSGHIFFNDKWYGFDDGLYVGARLLEMLSEDGRSASEIFDELPEDVSTPELKLYVDEDRKFVLMSEIAEKAKFENAESINSTDGLRVVFSKGWGLVRPSNTTPCLTLRFEASDEDSLNEIKNEFRAELLSVDASLELPF